MARRTNYNHERRERDRAKQAKKAAKAAAKEERAKFLRGEGARP